MLYLDSVVIETTRNCNLECPHCLRGPRQSISMKREYLHKFLTQVDYINTVTFTGGEPTLPTGLRTIGWFLEKAPSVGNFYIVTNGNVSRRKLPEILHHLWNRCEENEISSVDVSEDKYHYVSGRNRFICWLQEEMLYRYGIELHMNKREVYSVIAEGNAKDWGEKHIEEDKIIWNNGYETEDDVVVREGILYLNCRGKVILGCDWSYANQNDHILCSVDEDIEKAIRLKGTYDENY